MKSIALRELKSHIGEDLGESTAHEITQQRVNLFADATDDHQWIHVDPERARSGPFGGTIAHGYLSLALVPSLLKECLAITGTRMGVNYGLGKVRFPAPVPVGGKIRLSGRINNVVEINGGYQLVVAFTVTVDGQQKPSVVGEAIYNYYS